MSPLVLKSKLLTKMFSVIITVNAICLFPFIIVSDDLDQESMNHELIHFEQQKELYVIGFYALYVYDYFKGLYIYKDREMAYYNIRFEQEAYQHERNLGYVAERRTKAWKKYEV